MTESRLRRTAHDHDSIYGVYVHGSSISSLLYQNFIVSASVMKIMAIRAKVSQSTVPIIEIILVFNENLNILYLAFRCLKPNRNWTMAV